MSKAKTDTITKLRKSIKRKVAVRMEQVKDNQPELVAA